MNICKYIDIGPESTRYLLWQIFSDDTIFPRQYLLMSEEDFLKVFQQKLEEQKKPSTLARIGNAFSLLVITFVLTMGGRLLNTIMKETLSIDYPFTASNIQPNMLNWDAGIHL